MAQGFADNKSLQSSDNAKVDVSAGELLTKDLTTDDLLKILILELREFKDLISTVMGN